VSGARSPRFRLAASILSADFGRLADEVRAAEAAGADWLHVDVMDGRFVPNLTIGPDVVGAIARARAGKIPVDVHLMIEEPDRYLERFVEAGATALGVHVEACPHLHRTLQSIRALGVRACVALNPATPASAIEPVLGQVDQVLVMTVNPGFGNQRMIREALLKLRELRTLIERRALAVDLVVDGGIGLETVEEAALNGAHVFVMGSAFFGSGDYKRFVDAVRARLRPYADPGDGPGG
jgi:ribulose-phosphate 3-epimerase